MGFVEAIAGEFLHQIENVFRKGFVDAVVFAAIQEELLLLGHFFGFFLTHGTAQHVGVAEGVARHHLSNLHDLLLVKDNPIGGLQNRLQAFILIIRMRERHGLLAVLTIDKVINHARLQRARAEQCHQGDHIFQ